MSSYELMLVTPVSLSKEQESEFFKKTEDTIQKNNGQIISSKPMGKRKLAYPIAGQNEGIYTVTQFQGSGQTVAELERLLKISGEVLRHGIFKEDPRVKRAKEKK